MPDGSPLFLPVQELRARYRDRSLSPVEVVAEALDRIDARDGELHAYLTVLREPALAQARTAERRYREERGALPPLLGVPTSIKDLFDVGGAVTTMGSLAYADHVAAFDSEVVSRLRSGGAVLVGKTNTAEFGQSATTENRLGDGCGNPWDPARTAGGSSGGAAASVGAGLASVALGSDGGGSIRIPAAFCGLFGLKPTYGLVSDDGAFSGMSDFACPGPIARRVADARPFMEALTQRAHPRGSVPGRLRVAWCARPEGNPVDPRVVAATTRVAQLLAQLGHDVVEAAPPVEHWKEIFGPLVLSDEWRERRELLDTHPDRLTTYARRSIEAASRVEDAAIAAARGELEATRTRFARYFEDVDVILTPTTATVAFPLDERPAEIAGEPVDWLWGAFPFTAPFNVSGCPAASLPCGLGDGLPIGVQLVARHGGERLLLDVCEELEEALAFPHEQVERRWSGPHTQARSQEPAHVRVERHGAVAVLRIDRPRRRNALRPATLAQLRDALAAEQAAGARAIVLTGGPDVFSAGIDLADVGNGGADVAIDEAIAATTAAIAEASVPVLAAIEGACVGAALDLALACDVRIAGDGALFALPATRLGLLYRVEGLQQLVRRVGSQTASRLLLLDERIAAGEAVAAGIAARVVPAGTALEQAVQVAERAAGCEPEAVASTKRVVAEAVALTLDVAGWDGERRRLLASDGRAAAVARAREQLGGSGAAAPAAPDGAR